MEWTVSMKTIKNHIQHYLYQWFTSEQNHPSTVPLRDFPFSSILDNQEWKDSIFFGSITYQDLLVQSYRCHTSIVSHKSSQIVSQWIPDISIYLLSTLFFGGTLVIKESSTRKNSFQSSFHLEKQIDNTDSTPFGFKDKLQKTGVVYMKDQAYSADYLLRAVGQFVSTLQRDPQHTIFDQFQQVSLDTKHNLENLILLVYALLMGKKIVFYSLDATLTNQIIPLSEFLISNRNIWKPTFRPTHIAYIFDAKKGRITMLAKPLEDSISIRNLEDSALNIELGNNLVYTSDIRTREETLKTVFPFNHFKKASRHLLFEVLQHKNWVKILWIPARKQIQLIQNVYDTLHQSEINSKIPSTINVPDIPIYQRLVLLLVFPILLFLVYTPIDVAPTKKQALFWSCPHSTNWLEWLPKWIQTSFPYLCWIWVPQQSTPLFAIGGKIIWGKWPGWSQLWFSIFFLTKWLGIPARRILHIRILTPSQDSEDENQDTVVYTSARKTPYISVSQYPNRTFVQANVPTPLMENLKSSLINLKK